MECCRCPITLACWSGCTDDTLLHCSKCNVTMWHPDQYWYLWHCPAGEQPRRCGSRRCAECRPFDWAPMSSLGHIINQELVNLRGSAHRRWRKSLYRLFKAQKYAAEHADELKQRHLEAEEARLRAWQEERNSNLRRKKYSDIGRIYK